MNIPTRKKDDELMMEGYNSNDPAYNRTPKKQAEIDKEIAGFNKRTEQYHEENPYADPLRKYRLKRFRGEDAETEANVTFDHSVVFQLEGPLSMGVTPLERDVDEASAGLADRKEKEEANGMLLVSDEDGKCILFYNGEELDQDGLEAAVKSFHDAEKMGE